MLRPMTANEVFDLVQEARTFMQKCDWSRPDFSLEKAAMGAVMSQLAYCATKQDEREAATRAKYVPCEMFQRIVAAGQDFDVTGMSVEADFLLEIIRTPTLVAAALKAPDICLVAIRGTQFMYEWGIDLDCRPWRFKEPDSFVHTGFFKDALILSARLHRAFHTYPSGYDQEVKICVFGHSLGGAVAAVLKLWGIEEIGGGARDGYTVEHCYTYGAPRFASDRICAQLRSHAIRRRGDVVPSVPSEDKGFANYLEQYTCAGIDWRARNAGKSRVRKIGAMLRNANAYHQHMIDEYKREILASLGP